MKPIYSQEQIEEMRKRLYDRGTDLQKSVRHELTDEKIEVSRDWSSPMGNERKNTSDLRNSIPVAETTASGNPEVEVAKPKRHYRSFVLLGSFLIFILVAVASSLYLYFGGNQVSSDNIQLSIQGKPLIGGGEVMSLQVAVTNQNTVPIESATLILKYPAGTRTVGDSPRNLFEERIPLDNVAPGEVQNVPIRVAVFGEENAEKQIEASIEYRIEGTNSMLYKDAEPLAFRISSSPLVLRIDSIEKVASGQIADITITAVSNASTPLQDILITAAYPNGFDFVKADPAPVYGDNVWHIKEILSEQSATIKLQGVVMGLTEETFRINFSAGPKNSDNQYQIGAVLAESRADFLIERPFIDVEIAINGDKDRAAVIAEGEPSTVAVNIKNTLDETVYDMVVEVVPGGNALEEKSISSSNGFYDSNTGTVRWETSNNPSFDRVLPGDNRQLSFSVVPGSVRTTAAFDLVVNVYARRVAETSAQETLIGTASAEAKYASSIALGSQVSRGGAGFVERGPTPPKVGEETTYTLTLVAEAGANDAVDAVVDTSLPVYVQWLDLYDTEGNVTYNDVSKKLQWSIGTIAAGSRKELSFQVSIRPSISQVGDQPVLLNGQSLRANDRFTGSLLQDSASAVTTELSKEMGYQFGNGEVVQ
jgi:hypothetical protein